VTNNGPDFSCPDRPPEGGFVLFLDLSV